MEFVWRQGERQPSRLLRGQLKVLPQSLSKLLQHSVFQGTGPLLHETPGPTELLPQLGGFLTTGDQNLSDFSLESRTTAFIRILVPHLESHL